jgi:hypothetical protein
VRILLGYFFQVEDGVTEREKPTEVQKAARVDHASATALKPSWPEVDDERDHPPNSE